MRADLALAILVSISPAFAAKSGGGFSDEQLSVAKFWEDMGPTLRDEGIEAYAIRYHPDFRNWDITGKGGMATKEDAVGYFTQFSEAGHKITCTYVEPITIDISGDRAFARLVYEQTITYADGRITTGVWRIVDVFARYGDTWQVLESNMANITPKFEEGDESDSASNYKFNCPSD